MNLEKSIRLSLIHGGQKQKDLAAYLGVGPTQISNYMASNSMRSEVIEKIAEFFGITSSEFIKRGE